VHVDDATGRPGSLCGASTTNVSFLSQEVTADRNGQPKADQAFAEEGGTSSSFDEIQGFFSIGG